MGMIGARKPLLKQMHTCNAELTGDRVLECLKTEFDLHYFLCCTVCQFVYHADPDMSIGIISERRIADVVVRRPPWPPNVNTMTRIKIERAMPVSRVLPIALIISHHKRRGSKSLGRFIDQSLKPQ